MTLDDAALPVLTAIGGAALAAIGMGVRWGTLRRDVDENAKGHSDHAARIALLEQERVAEAERRGALQQRLSTLEAGSARVSSDVNASEQRLRQEMAGMEQRLLTHFDRAIGQAQNAENQRK